MKLIYEKKLSSSERYFINDDKLFYEVVREYDKQLHALVVPCALIKYIFHKVHEALEHNITNRTY